MIPAFYLIPDGSQSPSGLGIDIHEASNWDRDVNATIELTEVPPPGFEPGTSGV